MKITIHDMQLYQPVPVNEMAFHKSQMEAKLMSQTRNIVEWWGFLYYLAHYADVNSLTNHEKGKLRALLKELCEDRVLSGDASKIKRTTLQLHWGEGNRSIPGLELMTDKSRAASFISDRFYEENVDVPESVLDEVASAFMRDASTLIGLVADGSVEDIYTYIDATFPSGISPQRRKSRRRKR